MILTCPACGTQYVVKDGAIPAAGRQVRCASCKHSWHQEPEAQADAPIEDDVMASPEPEALQEPAVEEQGPQDTLDEGQQPVAPATAEPDALEWSRPDANYGLAAPALPAAEDPIEAPAAEPASSWAPSEQAALDEDFAISAMDDDDDEPRGRGLRAILLILVLVAAAAAAFWFLAPAEIKARVGLAEAGATPLEVMLTTSDRQKLASGNELLAISGRVINPTDRVVAVPPIRAELRNKATRQLVYQWTIAPPARSLPPHGSASFNSAEVDIPQGGDELTVSLGDAAI